MFNTSLFLKPVKMEDLKPFWNISTSFIQTSFILLCPKWRYTVEELTDGQKRSIMHNLIVALATQAPPQKPQGCTFAYTNIPDALAHCRSLPCFHGKSQINYLAAKENTSTSLHFSSYMTYFSVSSFFFLFLGASIFHFFTPITSTHNPISNSISQPFNLLSLFFFSSTPAMGNLKESFLDKSFSYCSATYQDKGLQQARLHLLAPLTWVAVWVSALATLQCLIFRWPESCCSTAATTNQDLQPNLATGCCPNG